MSQYLSVQKAKQERPTVPVGSAINKTNNGVIQTDKATSTTKTPRSARRETFFKELRRHTFQQPPSLKDDLSSKPDSKKSNSKKSSKSTTKTVYDIDDNVFEVYSSECDMYMYPSGPRRTCWNMTCYGVCRGRDGRSAMPPMKPGKWKKVRLVLTSDSILYMSTENDNSRRRSCTAAQDVDAECEVPLTDVAEFIAYGEFIHGVPGLPTGITNTELILMIPEEPRTNGRAHWLQLPDRASLHAWLLAICSVLTLPPAPPPAAQHSGLSSPTITGYHMSTVPPQSQASALNCATDTSLTVKVETGLDLLAKYKRDHPEHGSSQV